MSRSGGRRQARAALFRTVFQADVAGDSYAQAWQARASEEALDADQGELVGDVLALLGERAAEVDALLVEAAPQWPLARMAATDRAVLRCATGELLARAGTPARVVLDEAIDLAHQFGSDDSGRFVNGVLDRIARRLRAAEMT
jgi:N utilization substance protein B